MAITNIEASILARLKNQAKKEGINYQLSLQLFFQEEFLRRLSTSKFRDNMILKGGMFIYTLTQFDSRPTRDMDFMIRWMSNELSNIQSVMQEICEQESENDYITLEVTGAEQITLEKKYPGVKTKLIGKIKNVKVPFSIDVGIDDVIVPNAEIRALTTRLEGFSKPEICTYSIESTIAEKMDAILQRMETTSRMKDFFDIYYLSNMFDFEGKLLSEAVQKTSEHRGHALRRGEFEKIAVFADNQFLSTQWKAFEPAKEAELNFQETLDRIHIFMEPVIISIIDGQTFDKKWTCKEKKWK
ncbi:MAG: nucleotidyl transferase AbiEii/AbiGii toxin family protein [Hespellia sp.]|nr:nucleotidyl transferase AbiEii/AbiGii toxin family protein [Hespellia sp.]